MFKFNILCAQVSLQHVSQMFLKSPICLRNFFLNLIYNFGILNPPGVGWVNFFRWELISPISAHACTIWERSDGRFEKNCLSSLIVDEPTSPCFLQNNYSWILFTIFVWSLVPRSFCANWSADITSVCVCWQFIHVHDTVCCAWPLAN